MNLLKYVVMDLLNMLRTAKSSFMKEPSAVFAVKAHLLGIVQTRENVG